MDKFKILYNAGMIQIENKHDEKRIEDRWRIFNTVKQLTVKEVADGREKRED